MLWNTLLLSLRAITRNVLRSFLTILGVVIGVAAVITMVTLGKGATRSVSDQISSMGSNLLMLRPGQRFGPTADAAPNFKLADVEAIRAQITTIDAVAPVASLSVTAVYQARNWSTMVTGSTRVNTLLVSVRDEDGIDRARSALTQLLRERRKLAADDEDNFNVLDTRQVADTLSGTTQVMTTLLGAVAAVSLLVGGIGIMNIMLVSVTERTREIGVRLAIGALEREVLLQFLIEAVVLAALGGVVGVLLAALASVGLAQLMQVPVQFNPGINALALGFAAAIGVIFGYFPARRAARLDPIEALRHE